MSEEVDFGLDGLSACKSVLLNPSLLIYCLLETIDYIYFNQSFEMIAMNHCSASYRQRENTNFHCSCFDLLPRWSTLLPPYLLRTKESGNTIVLYQILPLASCYKLLFTYTGRVYHITPGIDFPSTFRGCFMNLILAKMYFG